MATADVLVVGAGVVGCSAALELAKLGLGVIVVDKAGAPGFGSTSASSTIVRFEYSTVDGVAAAWESKHCWVHWAEHLGVPDKGGLAEFVPTGYVVLDAPVVPRARIVELFDEVDVRYEAWDTETLTRRVPGIDAGRFGPPKALDDARFYDDPDGTVTALYTPDGGYVSDPQLATHNLASAAQRRGASFLLNRMVTSFDVHGDRVREVGLSDGTRIATRIVVNAAGPWSPSVNELAGVGGEFTVRVRPLRQEVHQVAAPPGYRELPAGGVIVADHDLGIYLRPAPGGLLLVGGTEPECDPLEWIDEVDQANPRPTVRQFQAQITRAARRFPGLSVPNAPRGIAGVYDVAEDWTPIFDRTDVDGFYVAMGTSGNQFKNAPLIGRFVATLVEGVEGGRDHDGDPLHHVGEYTGRRINLGTFSRKRPINLLSSGTVMG